MMTAEQLRNSILQLAMQGKLVEQRVEEGTGEELYIQIQEEKKRLIKEGKIKQQKPLSPIEDEMPFEIPNGWRWVKLGDTVLISTGDKDANHGCENGIYDFYTCSKEPIKSDTYSFDGECLLLPGNGANVGMTIYHSGKVEVYQRTYVIQKVGEFLDFHYLNNALDWNWKQYNSDKMFGSAIPYIKLGNLQNYIFPLPPLTEQKRIVAKIEELMPFVEQYAAASTKLDTLNVSFPDMMKKSILQEAVQGKLVPQDPNDEPASELLNKIAEEKKRLIKEGKIKKQKPLPEITEDEIPFDIPESWEWVRLGDVGETCIGLTYKPSDISEEGITVLRSGNIRNGKMDYSDVVKVKCEVPSKTKISTGDILICARNGSRRLVGKSAIVDKDGMAFGAFMAKFHSKDVLNKYVQVYIESPLFRESLDGVGTETINQITQKMLKESLCPIPPFEEQKRIVAKIEELMPVIDDLAE